MVRNPNKLSLSIKNNDRVNLLTCDIRDCKKFKKELSEINYLIHTATAWGDPKRAYEVNVAAFEELLALLKSNNFLRVPIQYVIRKGQDFRGYAGTIVSGKIKKNQSGELNTWAIFWYATIFKNKGLCVSPWFSYVRNIGFDGSGTNCKKSKIKNQKYHLNNNGIFLGIDEEIESKHAFKLMKKAYKKSLIKRFITFLLKKSLSSYLYEKFKNFSYK